MSLYSFVTDVLDPYRVGFLWFLSLPTQRKERAAGHPRPITLSLRNTRDTSTISKFH